MKKDIIRARIDAELKNSFEAIMHRNGLTASKVLRNFVVDYVEAEKEKEKREQETLDALEQTKFGNVVDGEVVTSWLKSWGTKNEKKLSL